MKNKKSTLVILLLVVITLILGIGGLALYQRRLTPVTPESVLKGLLNLKGYSTDVTYSVKNSRGEFREVGKIQYNLEEGTKITLNDKEQIFTDDKIIINYFKDNKTFKVDKDFDNFYKYLFVNEMPKFMEQENNVNYSWETVNEKEYLKIEYLLLSGNENFYRQVTYIDCKSKIPESSIIYDTKGNERIAVEYSNFIKDTKKKAKDIKS